MTKVSDELQKHCESIGLRPGFYEITYQMDSKELSVVVYNMNTYRKFLGRIPDKIQDHTIIYKQGYKFRGKTYV